MEYQAKEYQDKLLPDNSVERQYNTGHREIRRKLSNTQAEWEDDQGHHGIDEALGRKVVKRTYGDGRVIYGREQGYGHTAWSNGELTVNKSSFGGRVGAILAGIGIGVLVGNMVDPPEFMSPEEEEALRRQQAQAYSSDSDWGEIEFGFDDDFG